MLALKFTYVISISFMRFWVTVTVTIGPIVVVTVVIGGVIVYVGGTDVDITVVPLVGRVMVGGKYVVVVVPPVIVEVVNVVVV